MFSSRILSAATLALTLSAPLAWAAEPSTPAVTSGAGATPAALTPVAEAPKAADDFRVVYHADFADPRRFGAMLTSIHNMVTTYQNNLADYDVRIVFVSHGIRFVTEDKLANTPFAEDADLAKRRPELLARLKTLQETQGVKLELCTITKDAVRLDAAKLIPGVTLVPSGVVRLAELQRQGFAYLKIE
jgi:hypothetical protein